MQTNRWIAALFVALALAGCGGGGSGGGAAPPATSVTQTVGAAGGTIVGPGGVTLTIPPDALATDTALTIALDDAGAPPLPAGLPVVGATIALLPHGTTFSVPVTLTLALDPAQVPAGATVTLLKTNEARDAWTALSTERSGDTASAALTSFSNGAGIVFLDPGPRTPPPAVLTLLSSPSDCTVVEGGWCFFYGEALSSRSDDAPQYQWLRDGVPVAGEIDKSILINPLATADDGARYSLRISTQSGTPLTTVPATLHVLALPPAIVTQPLALQVQAGQTAVFSAASTSSVAQTLQWKRCNANQACPADPAQWTNTIGGTTVTYALPNAQPGDDGARFAMCASNAAGSACSNPALLSVIPAQAAPSIYDQPDDVSTVAGRSAQFVVLANGGGLQYQWQRSDGGAPFQAVAGETSATYTLSNVVPADDGARVRVLVSNGLGSVLSGTATLDVSPGAGVALQRVFGGNEHSLALTADARVIGWGANAAGELGNGSFADPAGPVFADGIADAALLGVGQLHSIALGSDGSLRAWGFGGNGRLGSGGTANVAVPGSVALLPPSRSVAAGRGQSLAVAAAGGQVRAWGGNNCGQLGDGSNTQRLQPVTSGLFGAVRVAAGLDHSHALRADGSVWSWGCNTAGQLGDGTLQARLVPTPIAGLSNAIALAPGALHTLALTNDGNVWAWGRNAEGQLGDGSTTARLAPQRVTLPGVAVAVAAGDTHSLALLADGRVFAWGGNADGQLGIGSNLNSATPVAVGAPLPAGIVSIGAGTGHSLALDGNGNVWAWGRNTRGQLGDGTRLPRDRPVQAAGVNLN
jgi:alpha-tubulin suppressor-like RCC1 family protein